MKKTNKQLAQAVINKLRENKIDVKIVPNSFTSIRIQNSNSSTTNQKKSIGYR